jgi:hypothetical protein
VITGLVVEDPFRMGYDGVKTALAASKGEQVSIRLLRKALWLGNWKSWDEMPSWC